MNQGIIDYLDGYWELNEDDYGGYGEPRYDYSFSSAKGLLEYYPKTSILCVWSGLGLGEYYGYEVQIRGLTHLIQLESLL